MQKVGCVCWFHDRYHSRRYSNFAKKGAELVYLYRNFLFNKLCLLVGRYREENDLEKHKMLEVFQAMWMEVCLEKKFGHISIL